MTRWLNKVLTVHFTVSGYGALREGRRRCALTENVVCYLRLQIKRLEAEIQELTGSIMDRSTESDTSQTRQEQLAKVRELPR